MEIPQSCYDIQAQIDKHHEQKSEPPRPHLGCSVLGHPCDRWLWLSFRWAVVEKFPGRILRLFRRGQLEEATLVQDLRAIGVDVWNAGKDQARVDFGYHIAGSVDGVAESGVPGGHGKRHVLEFKTHSLKSFNDLTKEGVEKSKPMHFAQVQLYMHGLKIDRALYVAICKDDDRIYTERIRYETKIAQALIERGKRITMSDRMPEPVSTDPGWYVCKMCPAREFCHKTKLTEEVNCRTCAHSTAKPNSTWRCEYHGADGIPVEWQRKGCDGHVLHPDLVPWQRKDGLDQWTAVYVIDGKPVSNGEPDATIFSSREILANPVACANPDEFMNDVRAMEGRILK